MSPTLIASILLVLPALLQAWLAVILGRKRLYRIFPFFFSYTAFAVLTLFLKLVIQTNYKTYFYVYWTTEAVFAPLGLFAALEIFPYLFRGFHRMPQFRLALWTVAGLMLLLSIFHSMFASNVSGDRPVAVIVAVEIGVRYLQGSIFVFFVIMASFHDIRWRRYAFGIVFGFGLLAASRLTAVLLRSEFGMRFKFVFEWMPGVVYILAVLVWLFTFLKPETPDPTDSIGSPLSPEEVVARVKNLSKELRGSVR